MNNILVTGFGPFGDHQINPSWEAVKLLPDQIDNYDVIKKEIEVSYDCVDKNIDKLWEQHNPKLVVHVGVSGFCNNLQLETRARKIGYEKCDIFGNKPKCGNKCPLGVDECIEPVLNIKQICEAVNSTEMVKVAPSDNAGLFLCEYIFYSSLSINRERALFVHVPILDKPYSAQEIADGLVLIIKHALKQL